MVLTEGVPTEPAAWFAVCAATGLLAAVVMDYPMSRQPQGFEPAYVAAGVLTRRAPEAVPFRDAVVAHHAFGPPAGVLYGIVTPPVAAVLPDIAAVGGLDLGAHVLGVALTVAFVYLFFSSLVLPRAGRYGADEATAITGQWLRSAVVFGAALFVGVPAALVVLA